MGNRMRKSIAFIAISFLFAAILYSQDSRLQQESDSLFAAGVELYKQGKYEEAILLFAVLYVCVVSAAGMVVSNYSNTMQQAMFVMFFFLIIFMITCGLFTPIKSMPDWMQWCVSVNPLKYFVQALRLIYLKGSGFAELLPEFAWLCGFAVVFNVWAVWSYKKSL